MPVTKNSPAPYAPATVILSLVERYRHKGLPTPISADILVRAGVSDSLVPRSLYALKILDLIDENGNPTSILEGLRLAPEAEYKIRLAEWLRDAYADALSFVNPATADETQVRDAFRSYNPVGQQTRMASLFMGLFQAAGIAERVRKRQKATVKTGDFARRVKTVDSPFVLDKQQPEILSTPPVPSSASAESIAHKLLEKFPAFDPSWSAEIQAKWFEGYEKLLAMSEKK